MSIQPRDPNQPSMLFIMNTLQLPTGELSRALKAVAARTDMLTFMCHEPGVFVSDTYDVRVSETADGPGIEVAEPECGRAVIQQEPNETDGGVRDAQRLLYAINARRTVLQDIMRGVANCVGGFPDPGEPCTIGDVAQYLDVHVTTVARALDNKWCLTPQGAVPCRQFVDAC